MRKGSSQESSDAAVYASLPVRPDKPHSAGWRDLSTAPRDGSWILIRNEDDRIVVGRWQPEASKIGDQVLTYEWLVLTATYDHSDNPEYGEEVGLGNPFWDNWAEGYACEWQPLPPAENSASSPAEGRAGNSAMDEQ